MPEDHPPCQTGKQIHDGGLPLRFPDFKKSNMVAGRHLEKWKSCNISQTA